MKKILPFLYSLIILLIGGLLSTLLYYFNITSDNLNKIFLYATGTLSIFIGSIELGKSLKFKGIISGVIYYFIFILIMLLFNIILLNTTINFKNIIYYIIIFIFSLLGGILGKNIKKETAD